MQALRLKKATDEELQPVGEALAPTARTMVASGFLAR